MLIVLFTVIENKNYGTFIVFISILGDMRDKRAIEPLIKALGDRDKKVREKAIEVLKNLGWKPRNDTEKAYYLIAKQKWSKVVEIGEPAVIPLIQALNDRDAKVRRMAAEALM